MIHMKYLPLHHGRQRFANVGTYGAAQGSA